MVRISTAASLVERSTSSIYEGKVLPLVRVNVGPVVRYGINAREVVKLSPPDNNARGALSKPLAVLNGTERFGRGQALSDEEVTSVVSLRAADPVTWSWRKLADHVNEERNIRWVELVSASERGDKRPRELWPVSHMAVKRAVERAVRLARL